jgi:3-methyladenine DNA glycosylase AlkD
MNAAQARALGATVVDALRRGETGLNLLAPCLQERTRFAQLDRIGEVIGSSDEATDNLLREIAADDSMGGWVVIASTLRKRLETDRAEALDSARRFAAQAAVWHAVDGIGERVVGALLVDDLDAALPLLESWRASPDPWVRRSLGAGVHFWAKRSRGSDPEGAKRLLSFLEPLFSERDLDAAKGIGWALKSLGRFYPRIAAVWLKRVLAEQPNHRALMRRKAEKYLDNAPPA